MDERLFTRLSALLETRPVVLASVLGTRGATPRKAGSRMLVTDADTFGSVGGGLAEARVVDAARRLLEQRGSDAEVAIDLTGRAGAAGVCGGSMRIVLRRWDGEADRGRAHALQQQLRAGRAARLRLAETGARDGEGEGALLQPDPRLLIVGAGHCGLALYQLARYLDYDLWVQDARAECFASGAFDGATCLQGGADTLLRARATSRALYVVLLNREFAADVASLDVLLGEAESGSATPPATVFIGMMGSQKRIAEVRAALPQHASALQAVQAPVGIRIGAETPHEIAVSILAQLLQERARRRLAVD